eukprot:TRINITY_DN21058_c0_g1_i2.p3 TRINITY_DN21058_c0_g1~~TRINITY_DN21058_c0_g1_i2.p3  ORF type:complete len:316 (+),score=91.18 TRINITY_DN21058_c0_g1_i2:1303-2250(+)
MAKINIKDLLEAGCHFGHQTKRWNPKMKDYVYGSQNGISIIDLTKTMHQIAHACNFLQRKVMEGADVLFVGTKRQAQQIIKETAEKTGMYYVSERWMGGTLTNNVTIRKSITRMYEIDELMKSGDTGSLKKKELSSLSRKCEKLHRDLDGIANMKKTPGVMVLVDVCHDDIAIREAQKLNIPIVAICDTNGDPTQVDYPVAANDDAVKSIKVIIDLFADAIQVASEMYQKKVVEEKAKAKADAEAKAEARKAEAKAKADDKKTEDKKPAAQKPVAKKPAAKKVEEEKAVAKAAPVEAVAEEAPEAEKAVVAEQAR